MIEEKTYTSKDLLEKIVKFTSITPEYEWNISLLKANPPRFILLRQIESLIEAFLCVEVKQILLEKTDSQLDDYKFVIQWFIAGKFIEKRTPYDYKNTIEFITDYVRKNRVGKEISDIKNEYILQELRFIYPILFEYKMKLNAVLSFNSGWMAASSITAQFALIMANSVSKNLKEKQNELNQVLEFLIDPKELSFTHNELIVKYNYPIESLEDAEVDFM